MQLAYKKRDWLLSL